MGEDNLTRILLVEDDIKLAELVGNYLGKNQFNVSHAANGRLALELARALQPHLIILDLMLPELDGFEVCRELRSWYTGRIIILTASDEDMDQVASLEIGADDYVTKPIHPRVLLARIKVLLRREEFKTTDLGNRDSIFHGGLALCKAKRQTLLHGKAVNLTEAEFGLLWLLANSPEQPLSRNDIMQALRGIEYDGLDRSIDNRIVSL